MVGNELSIPFLTNFSSRDVKVSPGPRERVAGDRSAFLDYSYFSSVSVDFHDRALQPQQSIHDSTSCLPETID